MKKVNITFLLIVLLSMIGLNASAYDKAMKNADGVTIYYNYINNNTELAVTYGGLSPVSYSNEYTGNVVIPESVTYNNKTYSVTSIGDHAFYGSSGLTSVTIPNSVTSIGSDAFSGCSGLTSVTWNAKNFTDFSSYSDAPFYSIRTQIKEFNLGEEVKTIPNYLCNGMTGLTSVTIPNSVTSIGESAFNGCLELTSVTLNSNSIVSKNYTSSSSIKNFFGTQVKSYIFGDQITSIGNYAFKGCSGLTSVTIPNNVTSIGKHAFEGCSRLTSINFGNNVTNIGESAFFNCRELTSVIIPNSVTNIGAYAFRACYALTSISIPSSVTSIGSSAFLRCLGLTSITIPNSVTSIESHTFNGCSGLTSVTIPSSVTNIGGSAFGDCSSLSSVTIPNSEINIMSGAFSGCSNLTTVTIDSNFLISKNYSPTSNLPNIFGNQVETYIIGKSVKSIGSYAFYGSGSVLTSVTISNSVTNIGDYAFSHCTGLSSIIIPNSMTSIGGYAFEYCSWLSSLTIPNSVTSIGEGAFYRCSRLTSVTIPNSVTNIRKDVFSGCLWLASVTIPNSVTSIGNSAFSGCTELTSITIPNSVTSIGTYAFSSSSKLTDIYSYIENPTSSTGSNFDNSNYSNATLYVPFGTKEKYLSTYGWKRFTKIVEMNETAVKEISASNINEAKSFSIDGKRLSQPQKGLNILKMSDGTTRKLVK